MEHRLKVEHAARVLKNYDAAIGCRLETTRYESQTQCDAMFVGGFQQGGQNIHYLEKRLAERKDKSLSIV